jgi:hypothetical protein
LLNADLCACKLQSILTQADSYHSMKKEFSKVRHSMQGAFNFLVIFVLKRP